MRCGVEDAQTDKERYPDSMLSVLNWFPHFRLCAAPPTPIPIQADLTAAASVIPLSIKHKLCGVTFLLGTLQWPSFLDTAVTMS